MQSCCPGVFRSLCVGPKTQKKRENTFLSGAELTKPFALDFFEFYPVDTKKDCQKEESDWGAWQGHRFHHWCHCVLEEAMCHTVLF